MASEQFSLSWDNFHKNMSSGMHALLENEDLVDVTLAMDGRHLKAHKMVLSVCSPYFRQLFNTNPCKHPIVFMKDVSFAVMSDLLTFMYQGEVQVNQEHLATFIKTAEALQIKGLTGDNNECDDVIGTPKSQKRALPEEKVKVRRESSPTIKKPKLTNSSTARSSVSPSPSVPAIPTSAAPKPKIERVTPTPQIEAVDVEFKIESYDPAEDVTSEQYDDIADDTTFGDETLDESQAEEDYSLMEGEEEPQAGTSGDAVNESQDVSATAQATAFLVPSAATGPKKTAKKPIPTPTSELVCNAIKSLRERGGSSLQAIKKFVAANYKVDAEKRAPFIKKYLRVAVASGILVQTKGKGASGSFKLAPRIKIKRQVPKQQGLYGSRVFGPQAGTSRSFRRSCVGRPSDLAFIDVRLL